jgi:hypothetical protein
MTERDPGSESRDAITATQLATLKCCFCGKPRDQVDDMVCGSTPAVAICNECVDLVAEIMAEQRAATDDAG